MRIGNRMGREDMAKFFYGQDHRIWYNKYIIKINHF
jgi:hypothetical protein